ncbi:hypothetical protein [Streptomyces sp. B6B3]|uniref:hypothetical protein n=1 Tax=Streptomyces sp. B6B3 TaxID=3153570 RepID=UPI00325F34CC
MSTGTAIILSAVVIAIVALACAPTVLQSSRALRRRFGPEFSRVVERHGGDVKAARKELSERLYRYGDLQPRPLEPAARERYRRQWAEIQVRWLTAPAEAVVAAEELVGRLAADRGYPSGDAEQTSDALSVRHARQVGGFRRLCAAARRVRSRDARTVELSGVLSGAEGIFEQLVSERPYGPGRRGGAGPDQGTSPRLPRQRARHFPSRA